jgi:hypothetical protein
VRAVRHLSGVAFQMVRSAYITEAIMFVVYDHRGRPRGRGESSGEALTEAIRKSRLSLHPKDRRAVWERLKSKGWFLNHHASPSPQDGQQK